MERGREKEDVGVTKKGRMEWKRTKRKGRKLRLLKEWYSENKGGMVIKYNDIRLKKKMTSNGGRRILMRLRREDNLQKWPRKLLIKIIMDSWIKKEYNVRKKIEKKEGKEDSK
jgi:hypothetical protein